MKKTLLSIGFLSAMAFAANAQDAATAAPTASGFKPGAGNITVEVLAQSPFAAGSPFALNNNQLRFRYFLNENTALRLGFGITSNSSKNNYDLKTDTDISNNTNTAGSTQSTSTSNGTVLVKSSDKTIVFTPGVEFHKGVSERLSVYYGAYALLSFGSAKGSVEVNPGSTKVTTTNTAGTGFIETTYAGSYKYESKGASIGTGNPYNGTTGTTTPGVGTRAANAFGLNLVIGADYYITKALYLGLECSWGLTATTTKKYTTTETNSLRTYNGTDKAPGVDAVSPQETKTKTEYAKNTFTRLAPTVNAAFRFGFWF